MNKAAGYIRVSTSSQAGPDKVSLQIQTQKIEEYCTYRKWEMIPYNESAASGATMERPVLQRLLADAAQGKFQAVIVADLSRFGRNTLHLKQNLEILKNHNVNFVSLRENIVADDKSPIGGLLVNILASIYEFERETIIARTKGTRNALWKEHRRFIGHLPFGYKWDEKAEKIVQEPEEAKIYKRLLSDYMDLGLSLRDIAIRLNDEHVPTRLGKQWSASAISVIFGYTLHYGNMTVNKKKLNAKGKAIGDKPEEEHIEWEAEPLITKRLWDQLHERLDASSTRSGRYSTYRDKFLLHGVVKCGLCGASISPLIRENGHRFYVCRYNVAGPQELRMLGQKRCNLPRLHADDLENWVYNVRLLSKLGANKEEAYAPLLEQEKWDEKVQAQEQTISHIKAEIARKDRGARKLRLAFMNPDPDDEDDDPADIAIFKSDHKQLIKEIQYLQQELVEATDKLEHFVQLREDQERLARLVDDDEQMELIHDKVRNLPFKEKKRLLQGLLDGPITIKLPDYLTDEEVKQIKAMGRDRYQLLICNNARVTFRFNQAILQDILGIGRQQLEK